MKDVKVENGILYTPDFQTKCMKGKTHVYVARMKNTSGKIEYMIGFSKSEQGAQRLFKKDTRNDLNYKDTVLEMEIIKIR